MIYQRIIISIKKHLQKFFIIYFIMTLLFIVSNIVGPLLYKNLTFIKRDSVLKIFYPYILNNSDYLTMSNILKIRFIYNTIFIILIAIFSFFSIGQYLIGFLVFYKGLANGYLVAYLIDNLGFKGFFISLISVYIQSLFTLLSLVGLSVIGISMSQTRSKYLRRRLGDFRNIYSNDFSIVMASYLIIYILGSMIEAYSFKLLIELMI